MAVKKTTAEFIAEAIVKFGDRYDYSKVEYKTIKTKVCIICHVHGEFWQSPEKHLMGQNCPKCNQFGKTAVSDQFVAKAIAKHGDRYDYSKVEYKGAFDKVCIVCRVHGEFYQRPNHHLHGRGCPECAKLKISEHNNDRRTNESYKTKQHFIARSKERHGDRYDYSKVEYINANTKVCIICPEHGEFWQLSRSHIEGYKCPKCNKLSQWHKSSVFVEDASAKHNNRYDYSKVEYKTIKTKVCIICPEHGEFWQSPFEHLSGSGCPKCSIFHGGFTTEMFIEKSVETHGEKYSYAKSKYINSLHKVCIVCPEHGEFWQSPTNHVSGAGCPECNYSHGERAVANFLTESKINFIVQKSFDGLVGVRGFPLRFDFYLPEHNACIEFDGPQHHVWIKGMMSRKAFSNLQEHDKKKNEFCHANNIRLLRIDDENLIASSIVSFIDNN